MGEMLFPYALLLLLMMQYLCPDLQCRSSSIVGLQVQENVGKSLPYLLPTTRDSRTRRLEYLSRIREASFMGIIKRMLGLGLAGDNNHPSCPTLPKAEPWNASRVQIYVFAKCALRVRPLLPHRLGH